MSLLEPRCALVMKIFNSLSLQGANTVSGLKDPVTVATSPTLKSSSVITGQSTFPSCSMETASPASKKSSIISTRSSPSSAKCNSEPQGSPSTQLAFNSCRSDLASPLLPVVKGDTESAAEVSSLQAKCLKEFDINSMPSARLLSEKEKRICTSLRLTPSQYIAIKGLMIKVSDVTCCLLSVIKV